MYLADYGTHSSIVIPGPSNEQWYEYLYGDWSYMVEGQDNYLYGLFTLSVPTRGALGRRVVSKRFSTRKQLLRTLGAQQVYKIEVDKRKTVQLRKRLSEKFRKYKHKSRQGLYFTNMNYVPHEKSYHLFHTCNSRVVQWIEETGAMVEGSLYLSRYSVTK